MYLGAGTTLQARLGEVIATTNVDVVTVAVDTSNVITVKTSQQLDGTTNRDIVDTADGFVDEITIKNTDTVTHSIFVRINDGVNIREIVSLPLAPASSLIYKPGLGWQTQGSYFGSGWITSGSIGNNAIVSGSIASGSISSTHLSSGAVRSGHLADSSIISGNIASGQIGDFHFASGAKIDSAEFLASDNLISAEPLTAPIAVTLTTSGALVAAMAGQSGRFPALGVIVDTVLSGQLVKRYFKGRVFSASWNLSGSIGPTNPVWLGLSGQISITAPMAGGSGLNQILGFGINRSGMLLEGNYVSSGQITRFALASGCILSGHIASGQINNNDFGSGSVRSGAIASGQIGSFHIASGSSVNNTRNVISDATQNAISFISAEAISGARAVNVDQSGRLRIAMAGVSGRMPAIGVFAGQILSGLPVSVLSGTPLTHLGRIVIGSGRIPTSGFGTFIYVGRSGELVTSPGVTSGMLVQRIGINNSSGVMIVNIDGRVTSGLEPTFAGNY